MSLAQRRSLPFALTSSLTLIALAHAPGCRNGAMPQTTAVAPVTQLQSSPQLTTPQFPSLGPITGQTRVPPPSTGSYGSGSIAPPPVGVGGAAAQNNYGSAGIAPMTHLGSNLVAESVPSAVQVAGAPPAGSAFGSTAIGSGIQTTGWESTSPPSPGFQSNNAGVPAQTNRQNPWRAGGMPTIDLTGAPSPPGYVPRSGTTIARRPLDATNGTSGAPFQANAAAQSLPSSAGAWQSSVPIPTETARPSSASGAAADGNVQWQSPRR
ncbi:MAG: hypothetical protein AAGD07_15910 [Planctomycetota bacterium]